MGERWGLGPVFAFEWLIASRRWQVYGGRVLVVGLLLMAISLAWWSNGPSGAVVTAADLASVGAAVRSSILSILVTLILFVSPTATAGAICYDRARGGLTHLMTTDLSDPEIVLGKLAARMIPIVGMILATLPVLAITTLLGGIDPLALMGTFAVTMGLALLGCSMGMALSVWARKPQEVLLATYSILSGWVLAFPIGHFLLTASGFGTTSRLAAFLELTSYLNPYVLAFAPHMTWDPWLVALDLVFLVVSVAVSGGLVVLAIRRLRPVSARLAGEAERVAARSRIRVRLPRVPGPWWTPSLDENPVLWREWHRQRPSRWTRWVWLAYYAIFGALCLIVAIGLLFRSAGVPVRAEMAAVVNGFGVLIGLLLMSVSASGALGDERVRGSLDVLMATPLSTRSILVGKWLGTFRTVARLAILPTLVASAAALSTWRWQWVLILDLLILVYGAALVSAGLLFATLFSRPGWAIGSTVAAYFLACIGWVVVVVSLGPQSNSSIGIVVGSPLYGAIFATAAVESIPIPVGQQADFMAWAIGWCLIYGVLAAVLFRITLGVFDRRLGRVSERPRAGTTKRGRRGDRVEALAASEAGV